MEEGRCGGGPASDFDGNGRIWPAHEAGELVCPLEDVLLKGGGNGCTLRCGQTCFGVPSDAEVEGSVKYGVSLYQPKLLHSQH